MKAGVCGPTGVNVILGSAAGAVDFGFEAATRGLARATGGAADPFTGSDLGLDAVAAGVAGAITAAPAADAVAATTACAAPTEAGVSPGTVCGKAAAAGAVTVGADTATAGAVAVTAGVARAGDAGAARPLPAAGFPPDISQ